VTNVMGSTNQRNMAADCKGDMVRRQGAWSFGVWVSSAPVGCHSSVAATVPTVV